MRPKRLSAFGLRPNSIKLQGTRGDMTKSLNLRSNSITKSDMSKNVLVLAMKVIEYIKISGKFEKNLVKINLLFIIIFLNIWDFIISRELLNAMSLGILMFGPVAVFVAEGFELSGVGTTLKSLFWLPYLLMTAVNGFWGLKIYSEYRERKAK